MFPVFECSVLWIPTVVIWKPKNGFILEPNKYLFGFSIADSPAFQKCIFELINYTWSRRKLLVPIGVSSRSLQIADSWLLVMLSEKANEWWGVILFERSSTKFASFGLLSLKQNVPWCLDYCCRQTPLGLDTINVTSFSSISYCSNSEYWTKKLQLYSLSVIYKSW